MCVCMYIYVSQKSRERAEAPNSAIRLSLSVPTRGAGGAVMLLSTRNQNCSVAKGVGLARVLGTLRWLSPAAARPSD